MHNSKKLVIVAQVFISCLMALLMSGIFSYFHLGFTMEWLHIWSSTFIIAWPIVFVLSMVVGPLSFRTASIILSRTSAS
ncbi:DUF2798 domain-containing protein [Hoeflea sp. AS60]|uniref:DUF2798 domain-containing protein n=1 Tax=Hoeflea sp. AS60 TaxID=3135780 RepID=UPI00316D66AB